MQHSCPTAHVTRPQLGLNGYTIGLSHGVGSQLSPGSTQVPQLGLQHTSPTLQVDLPHSSLTGYWMRLSHGVGSQF